MSEKLTDRLIIERKRLKMSQDAIAEAVGVSRNNISLYERGKLEPSYKYLMYFAKNGTDMNWLLTGKESIKNSESLNEMKKMLDRLIEQLIKNDILTENWFNDK